MILKLGMKHQEEELYKVYTSSQRATIAHLSVKKAVSENIFEKRVWTTDGHRSRDDIGLH